MKSMMRTPVRNILRINVDLLIQIRSQTDEMYR